MYRRGMHGLAWISKWWIERHAVGADHGRRTPRARAVLPVAVLAIGVLAEMAACSSSDDRERSEGDSATAFVADSGQQRPPGDPVPKTQRAHVFGAIDLGEQPGFASGDLSKTTSGWGTSDHRKKTIVWAGASRLEPSLGLFLVFREDYIHGTQRGDLVKVPGAGEIRITRGPTGTGRIQAAAQKRGVLHWRSSAGMTGKLSLDGDVVRLEH